MRKFCVLKALGRMGRKDEVELRKRDTDTKKVNVMLRSNLQLNPNPF